MNTQTFRLVFSKRLHSLVPVAEFVNRSGKSAGETAPGAQGAQGFCAATRLRLRRLAACIALVLGTLPGVSLADLPTGGAVSVGSGTINVNGQVMTIEQATQRMGINWLTYNIGTGQRVRYLQPNADAVALNRVTGNSRSEIYGALEANGRVFLINPNGILFGRTAEINVGGLLATTRNIADADFAAGRYQFTGSSSGEIINQGNLKATDGGSIVLAAQQVRNEGNISAQGGRVVMAAGETVDLTLDGQNQFAVRVDGPTANALVENKGLITADGGSVWLTAKGKDLALDSAINMSGVITAHGGTVVLDGGDSGVTQVHGGTIDVSGKETTPSAVASTPPQEGNGGTVILSGQYVGVLNGATINASGAAGGGKVIVGGDLLKKAAALKAKYNSEITDIRVADKTIFDSSSKIDISSSEGDGGFVETSGKSVAIEGAIVGASKGKAGQWLIDPTNLFVVNSTAGLNTSNATVTNVSSAFTADSTNASYVLDSAISQASADVTLSASGGDIYSDNKVVVNNAGKNVTFAAANAGIWGKWTVNNLIINTTNVAGIMSSASDINAKLIINSGDTRIYSFAGVSGDITVNGGNLSIYTNSTLARTFTNNIYLNGGAIKTGGVDVGALATGDANIVRSNGINMVYIYTNTTGTHYFNTTGTNVSKVDFLLVGGGGGSGGNAGGGGGGGGYVYKTAQTVSSAANSVVVGAGGALGANNAAGSKGGNTTFNGNTALGGGGGGSTNSKPGASGGSGGGGGYNGVGGAATQNTSASGGSGNKGGNTGGTAGTGDSNAYPGGGGGGAGSAGTNGGAGSGGAKAGGDGGAGLYNDISGINVAYAGGGGGGSRTAGAVSVGGVGGGGNGSSPTTGLPQNGTSNTGGGAGGGGCCIACSGATGGSGIAVIRYNADSGTNATAVTLTGAVTLAAGSTSTINAGGNNSQVVVSSAISGDGNININSTAANSISTRVTLTANNTYTGNTILNSGVLEIGDGGTNGSIYGGNYNAGLAVSGSGGLLAFNRSDNIILGAEITGGMGIGQNGAGNLTLTGNNTYTGNTQINRGNLIVGDGGTNGTLGGGSYAGEISGAGSLIINNNGNLTLSGSNTYTGGTIINSGTIKMGSSSAFGASSGGVNLNTGATIDLNGNTITNTVTLNNSTITSSSTANSFIRNVILNGGGTLTTTVGWIGLGAYTMSGTGDLTVNGKLYATRGGYNFNMSGNLILNSGQIDSYGALKYNNCGTIVNGGLLNLRNDNISSLSGSGGTVSIGTGYNANINQTQDGTFAGVISGAGNLTKNNTGTLTLTGNNSYSGITTIANGSIIIDNGAGGTGGGLFGGFVNNGTLILNSTNSVTMRGGLTGSGNTVDNTSLIFTCTTAGVLIDNNITGTGSINVTAGKGVQIAKDFNISGNLVVNSTGSFYSNANNISAGNISIDTASYTTNLPQGIYINGGCITAKSGDINFLEKVFIAGDANINAANNVTFSNTTEAGAMVFTDVGNWKYTVTTANNNYLVVGGGASAGGGKSGEAYVAGGGGGGATTGSGLAAGTYNVMVGAGGASSSGGANSNGNNGSASALDVITANGGVAPTTTNAGTGGASGNGYAGAVKSGTTSGGGGGANGAASGTTGGAGLSANITGTTLVYGTGGSGGSNANVVNGVNGLGSGGKGGTSTSTGYGGSGIVAIRNTQQANLAISAANVNFSGAVSANANNTINTLTINNANVSGKGMINATNVIANQSAGGSLWSANIGGKTNVTKIGSGNVTLSGNNVYNGTTLINEGALLAGSTTGFSSKSAFNLSAGTIADLNGFDSNVASIEGAGNISLNGNLTFGSNNINKTFAGLLNGAGSVTKIGTGKQTLTGNNTYSGNTIINNGMLEIGDGGTNGAIYGGNYTPGLTVSGSSGGFLAFNRADNVCVSACISGALGIAQNGVGNLTLTGNNTYTGATRINNGNLVLGEGGAGNYSGGIAIVAGADLIYNNTLSQNISGIISGAGDVIKNSSGDLNLTAANTLTGNVTVNTGTMRLLGGGTVAAVKNLYIQSGATFESQSTNNDYLNNSGYLFINGTLALNSGRFTRYGEITMNNGTITGTAPTAAGGDAYTYGNLYQSSNEKINAYGSCNTISNITFGSWSYTLTINTPNANDALCISAVLGSKNDAVSVDRTAVHLYKIGAGNVTLTSNNNINSGVINIDAGTLIVGNGSSGVIGNGSYASAIGLNGGNIVFNNSLRNQNLSGAIKGSGNFTQNGNNTIILTGANTYTGTTTINNNGTLQIGNNGTTGAIGSGAVYNNGTLALMRSNALTVAGAISGSGKLIQGGAGVSTLAGENTYSGNTTINGGTLQIGNGSSGSLNASSNVFVDNNGTLAVYRSTNTTFANNISGSGNVTNSYLNTTLALTGNINNFCGTFIIPVNETNATTAAQVTAGRLNLTAVALKNFQNITFDTRTTGFTTFTGNATLVDFCSTGVTNTTNTLMNGYAVDGNGEAGLGGTLYMRKSGNPNSLVLGSGYFWAYYYTGNNTRYMSFTSCYSTADQNLTTTGSLTARVLGGTTVYENHTISGNGNYATSGLGTLVMTMNNTYTGSTTIGEGTTLQLGNNTGVGCGTLYGGNYSGKNIVINGTLAVNHTDAITLNANLTGAGGVSQLGSGNLTLTGGKINYQGDTVVGTNRTLIVGNGTAADTTALGGGNYNGNIYINGTNGKLIFNTTAAQNIYGDVDGNGALYHNGNGSTAFLSDNTLTGAVYINAGNVAVGNGSTAGTLGSGNITNNATLTYNRSDDVNLVNNVSGSGKLNITAGGNVNISQSVSQGNVTLIAGNAKTAGDASGGEILLGGNLNASTLTIVTGNSSNINTSALQAKIKINGAAVTAAKTEKWYNADINSMNQASAGQFNLFYRYAACVSTNGGSASRTYDGTNVVNATINAFTGLDGDQFDATTKEGVIDSSHAGERTVIALSSTSDVLTANTAVSGATAAKVHGLQFDNSSNAITANIAQRVVNITAQSATKTYDGTVITDVVATYGTQNANGGFLSGDNISYAQVFNNTHVLGDSGSSVTLANGSLTSNSTYQSWDSDYNISVVSNTGTITQRVVNATFSNFTDKTFDFTNNTLAPNYTLAAAEYDGGGNLTSTSGLITADQGGNIGLCYSAAFNQAGAGENLSVNLYGVNATTTNPANDGDSGSAQSYLSDYDIRILNSTGAVLQSNLTDTVVDNIDAVGKATIKKAVVTFTHNGSVYDKVYDKTTNAALNVSATYNVDFGDKTGGSGTTQVAYNASGNANNSGYYLADGNVVNTSATTTQFQNGSAGTQTANISYVLKDDANFTFSATDNSAKQSNVTTTATIAQAVVSVTQNATVYDKTYDKTANAAVNASAVYSVALGNASVAKSGYWSNQSDVQDGNVSASAVFTNASAGTQSAALTYSLNNSVFDATNYSLVDTTGSTTATIAKANITVTTHASVYDKTYDKTANAAVNASAVYSVALGNASVAKSGYWSNQSDVQDGNVSASAVFTNASAGTQSAALTYSLNNSVFDATNYSLVDTTGSTTATIAKANITVTTHASVYDKTYDKTANAAVNASAVYSVALGNASVAKSGYWSNQSDVQDGNVSASAVFTNASAGTQSAALTYSLNNSVFDATNYSLVDTTGSTTATIAKANITVTTHASVYDKTYDKTANAAVNASAVYSVALGNASVAKSGYWSNQSDVQDGNVSASAVFTNASAGTQSAALTYSLNNSVFDATNYSLVDTTGSTTATIAKANITVTTHASVYDKTYDKTANAAVNASAVYSVALGNASVAKSGYWSNQSDVQDGNVSASAVFTNASAGTQSAALTYSLNNSVFDATNYSLVDTTGSTTATIAKANITVTTHASVYDKTYDKTANAAVNASAVYSVALGNASVAKSGYWSNQSDVQDGNVSASAVFTNASAGTQSAALTYSLNNSVFDATNYSLVDTTGSTTATIAKANITVTTHASVYDKTYDKTANAAVNASAVYSVALGNASVAKSGYWSNQSDVQDGNVSASAVFTNASAGTQSAALTYSLNNSVFDATNYSLVDTTGSTTATIAKANITVTTHASVYDKTYDKTANAAVNASAVYSVALGNASVAKSGYWSNQSDVQDGNVSASAVFTNASAGTQSAALTYSLNNSVFDATNYSLVDTTGSTTATIAKANITVTTHASVYDKTYDKTANAAVNASAVYSVALGNASVAKSGYWSNQSDVQDGNVSASAVFTNASAGTQSAALTYSLNNSVFDATNYSLVDTTGSTTATIAKANITVTTHASVYDKTYDKTANAAVNASAVYSVALGNASVAKSGYWSNQSDVQDGNVSASAVFTNASAGTQSAALTYSLNNSVFDATNYSLVDTTGSTTATIAKANITVTTHASVYDKTYDKTANAAVNASAVYSVALGNASVAKSGYWSNQSDVQDGNVSASAVFTNASAGTQSAALTYSLNNSVFDATNYSLVDTTGSTTATIAKANITVTTHASVYDKTYDKTANAAVNASAVYSVALGNASVAKSGYWSNQSDVQDGNVSASAVFTNASAGTQSAALTYSLNNSVFDATNYSLVDTTGSTTATIAKANITVTTHASVYDKTYDKTANAAVNASAVYSVALGNASVAKSGYWSNQSDVQDGNVSASAVFTNASAGTQSAALTYSLNNSVFDATNYSLVDTTGSTTATIAKANITVTTHASVYDKTYDKTANAAVNASAVYSVALGNASVAKSGYWSNQSDVQDGNVSASAVFTNASAGTQSAALTYSLNNSVFDATNYSLVDTTGSTTATIAKANITVTTHASVYDKTYDKTANAAVNASAVYSVALGNASVAKSGYWSNQSDVQDGNVSASAVFTNASAGTQSAALTYSLNNSVFDATNYSLVDTTGSTTATIAKANITVTTHASVYDKTYDKTANAAVNASAVYSVALGNASVAKSGYWSNQSDVQDGNVSASAVFTNASAGTQSAALTYSLNNSVFDATNYSLVDTTGSTTATIAKANITVTTHASVYDKTYDKTANAAVNASAVYSVALGNASVAKSGYWSNQSDVQDGNVSASAVFTNASAGTQSAALTYSLNNSVFDATNYSLVDTTGSTTATIAKANITVTTHASVYDKTYDKTANAAVNASAVYSVALGNASVAKSGYWSNQSDVQDGNVSASAVFTNASAGTQSAALTYSLNNSVFDATNYSLVDTTGSTTATIAKANITVTTHASVYDKTYDKTANAAVNASAVYSVALGNASVAKSGYWSNQSDVQDGNVSASAVFTNASAGTQSAALTYSLNNSVFDATNYSLVDTTGSTTATIAKAQVIVTSAGAVTDKTYDGTTNATLNTSAAPQYKIVYGDKSGTSTGIQNVTLNATASSNTSYIANSSGLIAANAAFASANANNAQAANITYDIYGDSTNYTFAADNSPNTTYKVATTAKIYQRSITITSNASQGKVYGQNDSLSVFTSGYSFDSANATNNVGLVASDSIIGNMGRAEGEIVGNYSFNVGSLKVGNSTSNAYDNYNVTFDGATNKYQISKRVLNATIDNQTKTYGDDDTALANIAVCLSAGALGGVVNNDVYAFNSSGVWVKSAHIDDSSTVTGQVNSLTREDGENVGNRSITGGTASINNSGVSAGNYEINSFNVSGKVLTITQKSVTLTGTVTVDNKTYDGTTNVTGANFSGINFQAVNRTNISTWNGTKSINDNGNLSVDSEAAILSFADANASANKILAVSNISVTGSAASNYNTSVGAITSLAEIYKRNITIAANSSLSKTYGTADAADLGGQYHAEGAVIDAGNTTVHTGLIAGDTIIGNMGRVQGEAANKTYNFTAGTLDDAGVNKNYCITFNTAANVYTINKAQLNVTANTTGKEYGDSDVGNLNTGYNITAGLANDTLLRVLLENGTVSYTANFSDSASTVLNNANMGKEAGSGANAGNNENVGTYNITQGKLNISTAQSENYTICFTKAVDAFEITQRNISVAANSTSKTYGESDSPFGYQLTGGTTLASGSKTIFNATGDAITHDFSNANSNLSGNLGRAHSGTAASEANGSYTITQGGLSNNNYNISFTNGTLSINKANLTATLNANVSKVYGADDAALTDVAQNITLNGIVKARTVYYFNETGTNLSLVLDDDNKVNGSIATLSRAANESVGNYSISGTMNSTLTGDSASNYQFVNTVINTTGKVFSITALNTTVSGLTAIDKTYDGSNVATVASTGYTIDNKVNRSNVYTWYTGAANVTIDDSTKVNVNTSATKAVFETLHRAENINVTISNIALAGTSASNYNLQTATANTTANITARAVTVNIGAGVGKTYDGTNTSSTGITTTWQQNGTGAANSGLMTAGDLSLTINNATFNSARAGTHNIDLNVAVTNGSAWASDYNVTVNYYTGGNSSLGTSGAAQTLTGATNATIAQRVVYVDAVTDSKTYDGTLASNKTVSVVANTPDTGLIGTDSLVNVTQAYTNAHVLGAGNSTLAVNVSLANISGGSAGSVIGDYNITARNTATGTIEKKSVTVQLNDITKTYDASNVATANGGVATGFIGNDHITAVTGTGIYNSKDVPTANTASFSGLTASNVAFTGTQVGNGNGTVGNEVAGQIGDYDLSFQNPTTANIIKATLTVKVDDARVTQGSSYSPTFSYTGLKGGETATSLNITPSVTGPTSTATAGTYTLTPTVSTALDNYDIVTSNGTLTVATPSNSGSDSGGSTSGSSSGSTTTQGISQAIDTAPAFQGLSESERAVVKEAAISNAQEQMRSTPIAAPADHGVAPGVTETPALSARPIDYQDADYDKTESSPAFVSEPGSRMKENRPGIRVVDLGLRLPELKTLAPAPEVAPDGSLIDETRPPDAALPGRRDEEQDKDKTKDKAAPAPRAEAQPAAPAADEPQRVSWSSLPPAPAARTWLTGEDWQ
jgi:fibronectin-binding autotransporter adhesin